MTHSTPQPVGDRLKHGQKPEVCPACEGRPAPENNPCGLCGFSTTPATREDSKEGHLTGEVPALAFGHFQRGAQACREMMARFAEATHAEIAQSIRLNWHPGWGIDPGRPPFVAATWEPEPCPSGEAALKALESGDEIGPADLELTARMLETWGPIVEPASPDGKVSFTRAIMDSAAKVIRYVAAREDGASGADGERVALRERAARLICEGLNCDPDEHIIGGQATNFEDYGPRWRAGRDKPWTGLTDYEEIADAILALRPLSPDQPSARERRLEDKDALIRDLTARAEAADRLLHDLGLALDPLANLAPDDGVSVSMTDPLGKWFTVANFCAANDALVALKAYRNALATEAKDGRAG